MSATQILLSSGATLFVNADTSDVIAALEEASDTEREHLVGKDYAVRVASIESVLPVAEV